MQTLRSLYRKGEPITMLTAHDFPSAHVAEAAGMEMVLVGDSLAMVALGMEDTSEVVMEEMLLHCRSVARAAKSAFTVGFLLPSLSSSFFFCVCVCRLMLMYRRLAISQWDPMKCLPNRLFNRPSASSRKAACMP